MIKTSPVRHNSRLHGFIRRSLLVYKHLGEKAINAATCWWINSFTTFTNNEKKKSLLFHVKDSAVGEKKNKQKNSLCFYPVFFFSVSPLHLICLGDIIERYTHGRKVFSVSALMSCFILNAWWWISHLIDWLWLVTSETVWDTRLPLTCTCYFSSELWPVWPPQ